MRKPRSGAASAPAPRHRMERVALPTGRQAARRESHGSAGASPYRLGEAPVRPIQSPTKSNQIKPNQSRTSTKPKARRSQTAATAGAIRGTDRHEHHFYHSIHSTTTYYIKLVQISHGEEFEES